MSNARYFEEDAIFLELQSLIYGAVKAVDISKKAHDYEDYVQEAQLELLTLIRIQQGLTEPDEFSLFKSRSYNKIVWKLRDLRRKRLKEEERLVWLDSNEIELKIDERADDPADLFTEKHSVEQLLASLTPREKELVLSRLNDRTSMLELADRYGCSEKTIYHYRKLIQRKFQENY